MLPHLSLPNQYPSRQIGMVEQLTGIFLDYDPPIKIKDTWVMHLRLQNKYGLFVGDMHTV